MAFGVVTQRQLHAELLLAHAVEERRRKVEGGFVVPALAHHIQGTADFCHAHTLNGRGDFALHVCLLGQSTYLLVVSTPTFFCVYRVNRMDPRYQWADSSQCDRGSSANGLLYGLCACCLVLVLFSAVMGSSPTARDRVAVQCSSLLERWAPSKKKSKQPPAAAAGPAANNQAPEPVQLAEKKSYGAYATDLSAENLERQIKGDIKEEIAAIQQEMDTKAFDVDKMLPTKDMAGEDHHQHVNATKTASQLRHDIHRSVNVHRDICNTQDGTSRLFRGENLLHDSRPFFEKTKRRLEQMRRENTDECPFAEFHTSSHSYGVPTCRQ